MKAQGKGQYERLCYEGDDDDLKHIKVKQKYKKK